jgi:hypothetical protein
MRAIHACSRDSPYEPISAACDIPNCRRPSAAASGNARPAQRCPGVRAMAQLTCESAGLAARAGAALRGTPLAAAPCRPCAGRVAPAPARAGFLDGLFGGGAKKPDAGKPAGKAPAGKKPGMRPVAGNCSKCSNKGGVTCAGCKGSGRNKANGNPFERFKCYECQVRVASALARGAAVGSGRGGANTRAPPRRRASGWCPARAAAAAAEGSRLSRRASADCAASARTARRATQRPDRLRAPGAGHHARGVPPRADMRARDARCDVLQLHRRSRRRRISRRRQAFAADDHARRHARRGRHCPTRAFAADAHARVGGRRLRTRSARISMGWQALRPGARARTAAAAARSRSAPRPDGTSSGPVCGAAKAATSDEARARAALSGAVTRAATPCASCAALRSSGRISATRASLQRPRPAGGGGCPLGRLHRVGARRLCSRAPRAPERCHRLHRLRQERHGKGPRARAEPTRRAGDGRLGTQGAVAGHGHKSRRARARTAVFHARLPPPWRPRWRLRAARWRRTRGATGPPRTRCTCKLLRSSTPSLSPLAPAARQRSCTVRGAARRGVALAGGGDARRLRRARARARRGHAQPGLRH